MLQLQAERPKASFLGEVRADGSVRGRFSPQRVAGDGLALGGLLLAIKSDGVQEMYRGVTEIADEAVDRALERHLERSEQVMARVRIDVADDLSRVQGVVVERLPRPGGHAPWDADEFREVLGDLDRTPVEALAEDLARGKLLDTMLQVLEMRGLVWQCTCSRARVDAMLRSLGAVELQSMIAEDHGAEILCQFCAEAYRLNEQDLQALLAGISTDA